MRTPTALTIVLMGSLLPGCVASAPSGGNASGSASSGNDCGVILAIAREHYRFGPDNPPPRLKPAGDEQWAPNCNTESQGFSFVRYTDPPPGTDPRITMKWVSFQRPVYDAQGAVVMTEIVHGPLAGIGYECRLHSGIAGWTVGECRTGWVS